MKEQEEQALTERADREDDELQAVLEMSRQEAKAVQALEDKPCPACTFQNKPTALACEICGTILPSSEADREVVPDADEDLALALKLQQQEEKKSTAPSVDLSHARDAMWCAKHQQSAFPGGLYDVEEESDESGDEGEDTFAPGASEVVAMKSRRGAGGADWVRLADGSIITKHDADINGRENARSASDHLTGMGDLMGDDMRLPNTAYNALRSSMKKTSGVVKGVYVKGKLASEDIATREGVLDPRTRKILWKLINKQAIDAVHGVVKTGKESRVYLAKGHEEKFFEKPGDGSSETRSETDIDVDSNPDLSNRLREWNTESEDEDCDAGGVEHDSGTPSPSAQVQTAPAGRVACADAVSAGPRAEKEASPGERELPLREDAVGLADDSAKTDRDLATSPPILTPPPSVEIAVKVFFTTLDQFSNRAKYVVGDPRYRSTNFSKQTKRQMIKTWAEKEYRNLIRVHRAGLPVPRPLHQAEHCLLMTFIGKDGWPAPQLHEMSRAQLSTSVWSRLYLQTVGIIRDLYQAARLVHADLSEYNILFHDRRCFVIDFGQAVDTGHADSDSFLEKDVENILAFFDRRGVQVHMSSTIVHFVKDKESIRFDGLASLPESEAHVLESLDYFEKGEARVQAALDEVRRAHGP